MTYHDVVQGTEEWLKLKVDKFSASKFEKLFMGKATQGYNEEIMRVVYGKLTGENEEGYKSKHMEDGNEREPFAREKYMMETFDDVKTSGFYELNEWIGCSLDGEVDEKKIIEIKCPKYTTMINYLLNPELLYKTYKYQVQGQLWIAEREINDMVAYHPKLPLLIYPVNRDEGLIDLIKMEVDFAIMKAKEMLKTLQKIKE